VVAPHSTRDVAGSLLVQPMVAEVVVMAVAAMPESVGAARIKGRTVKELAAPRTVDKDRDTALG
jgi:hypothetical protein